MNHLRQLMIEELQRRNFAATTIRTYVKGVEDFSLYFHRRPDQLGPEHIRRYQATLFSKRKFSPNTVILRLASLRFFYIQVLKRNWSIAETPYPRKVVHLPQILSPEEVTPPLCCREQSISSRDADDALCHWGAPHRSGASEGRGYR